jgi:hypothetical protein
MLLFSVGGAPTLLGRLPYHKVVSLRLVSWDTDFFGGLQGDFEFLAVRARDLASNSSHTESGKVHRGKGGTLSRRRLPAPQGRSLKTIKGPDMVLTSPRSVGTVQPPRKGKPVVRRGRRAAGLSCGR